VDALRARCKLFEDIDHSSYKVRSNVPRDIFVSFASAIQGIPITITSDNVSGLMLLAEEFSFTELQCDISAWSLSTLLDLQCRRFLASFDDGQLPFHRLISAGFDESTSRKMLILSRGNFANALKHTSPRLAESIPIHKCSDTAIVKRAMVQVGLLGLDCEDIIFVKERGALYSASNDDFYEYGAMIGLESEILRAPIVSDSLLGVPDTAVQFFRARWSEDREAESVFMAEGLTESAARKLMRIARGRYCLAWTYLHAFQRVAVSVFESAMLFSEMENRDAFGRSACERPEKRAKLVRLAARFAASLLLTTADAVHVIVTCQDAREFFQRNRDLLGEQPIV
jgi:hypothetical protein